MIRVLTRWSDGVGTIGERVYVFAERDVDVNRGDCDSYQHERVFRQRLAG
jgi:hypothetical protein